MYESNSYAAQKRQAQARARRCLVEVLEAVERYNGERTIRAMEVAGLSSCNTFYEALRILRDHGCVAWSSGHVSITERGKIVLALGRGKQYSKMLRYRPRAAA